MLAAVQATQRSYAYNILTQYHGSWNHFLDILSLGWYCGEISHAEFSLGIPTCVHDAILLESSQIQIAWLHGFLKFLVHCSVPLLQDFKEVYLSSIRLDGFQQFFQREMVVVRYCNFNPVTSKFFKLLVVNSSVRSDQFLIHFPGFSTLTK